MATGRHTDFYVQRRRLAVASLIGHCEAIAKAGLLPEPSEESLRVLIAETLSAFGMTHHQADGDEGMPCISAQIADEISKELRN